MGRTYRHRKNKNKHLTAAAGAAAAGAAADKSLNVNGQSISIELNKYLKSLGWTNETKLSICWTAQTGRGIFSNRNILAGQPIIELPFSALITMASIENDEKFKMIFIESTVEEETPPIKVSTQTMLSIYLLYMKHMNLNAAYLNTIPDTFSNPIFAKKSELMIIPDNLFHDIFEQNQTIKRCHMALSQIIDPAAKCDCCNRSFLSDLFSMESFKWAFMAVNTRTVYFNPDACRRLCKSTKILNQLSDEPTSALAPFLDLFNHSAAVNTKSKLSLDTVQLNPLTKLNEINYQISIDSNVCKYQQIFVNYGTLNNTKLLIEYGFSLNENKYDRITFSRTEINEFVKYTKQRNIHRNKFKFIESKALDEEMYVDRDDGINHYLIVVLTFLFVIDEHFDNILNQFAFNSTPHYPEVQKWCRKLIEFKRMAYEKSRNGLQEIESLEGLSESGQMLLAYINECINLLDYVNETFYLITN